MLILQELFKFGGLTGCLYNKNGVLRNVYVEGKIVATRQNWCGEIGGIVGYGDIKEIAQCHSTCTIVADYSGKVGGIYCGTGIVKDCYTNGSYIDCKQGYQSGVSWSQGYWQKTINCYSVVDMKNAGWPISRNQEGEVTSSFWAEESSGLSSSDYGTKVTVDQMRTQSTYTDAGWDFDTVWEMDPVTGYPRLQWEKNIK